MAKKKTNIVRLIRFRADELALAEREAMRLQCPVSDVIRAALLRVRSAPVTADEVAEVRLPSGWAARKKGNCSRSLEALKIPAATVAPMVPQRQP